MLKTGNPWCVPTPPKPPAGMQTMKSINLLFLLLCAKLWVECTLLFLKSTIAFALLAMWTLSMCRAKEIVQKINYFIKIVYLHWSNSPGPMLLNRTTVAWLPQISTSQNVYFQTYCDNHKDHLCFVRPNGSMSTQYNVIPQGCGFLLFFGGFFGGQNVIFANIFLSGVKVARKECLWLLEH